MTRPSLRNGYEVLLLRRSICDPRGMDGYMNIGKEHMAQTFRVLLGFPTSARANP